MPIWTSIPEPRSRRSRGMEGNLSHVFASQSLGVTQVGEHIWLVTFMQYDLGYFDDETCRLEPVETPSVQKCYPCLRNEVLPMSPEWTLGELVGMTGFEPTFAEAPAGRPATP